MLLQLIENNYLLTQTFGASFNLRRITLLNVSLERLQFLSIRVLINERATKMPQKWQDFNTINFDLQFSGLGDLNLKYLESHHMDDYSDILIEDENGSEHSLSIVGQIELKCNFQFVSAQNFAPAMMRTKSAV